MNEIKTYQNEGIIYHDDGGQKNGRQTSNQANKLYTIYDEFDSRYFYKLMKEGVYQEIEERIILQIKRFIEGVL